LGNFQVIKLILTGIRGSPFEHGLFEFDIFIPETYPNEHPRFHANFSKKNQINFGPCFSKDGKVHYIHEYQNSMFTYNYNYNANNKIYTLSTIIHDIQKEVMGDVILDQFENGNKKIDFFLSII